MKKRVLSLVISCALAFGSAAYLPDSFISHLTSISASAGETASGLVYKDYNPTTIESAGYIITGYNGNASELVIPEYIDGRPVLAIGEKVFRNCQTLKKVTLPSKLVEYKMAFDANTSIETVVLSEGILRVADSAFENCTSLKSVTLPSTLEVIDDYAFNGCTALESITLPKSLCVLGTQAFSYCGLKSINVPSSVETIGVYAFSYCKSLSSVTLNKGLKLIDNRAFYSCTALESIVLPESLTSIKYYAFKECKNLKNITIPKSLAKLEPCFDGTPWYDNYKAQQLKDGKGYVMINDIFYELVEVTGTTFTIPSNTKYIVGGDTMSGAFAKHPKITSIILNEGLEGIGDYAFYPTSITSLKIPSTVKEIGSKKIVPYTAVVTVASGNKYYSVYDNGLYDIDKTYLYHYPSTIAPTKALPSTLKTLGQNCFSNNEKMTELTLPNSVNMIDNNAFYNCTTLKKLTVPASVYLIKFNSAFGKNTNGIIPGFNAYVYPGSEALNYCKNNKIPYVELDACSHAKTVTDNLISDTECGNTWEVDRCSTCGKSITTKSAVSGHDIIKEHKFLDATCVHGSYNIGICKKCCEEVLKRTAQPTAHPYGPRSGDIDLENKKGKLSQQCTYCKSVRSSEISFGYSRYAGADRFETAASISESTSGTKTVILAYGLDFPDALAGVPLARKKNAPILLTQKDNSPESTLKELTRIVPKEIIILGGEGVISQKVVQELKSTPKLAECTITRVSGSNRYGTAVETAKLVNTSPKELFFVCGSGYPDALSAGTVAALKNAPIIYLDKNGAMDSNTAAYLAELANKKCVQNAYFIGGEGVISNDMMNKASSSLGLTVGSNAQRVWGANRYTTNIAVNNKFKSSFDTNYTICIAKGLDFPDALAGGAFSAYMKTPLVLEDAQLTDEQKAYIYSRTTRKFHVFGGTGAVSDDLVKQSIIAAY